MPRGTLDLSRLIKAFAYKTLTSCGGAFQLASASSVFTSPESPQPLIHSHKVWALPSSLAATGGIDLSFSSSGYLDVSVPQVRPSMPILFSIGLRDITPAGLPHSGIYGSLPACGYP